MCAKSIRWIVSALPSGSSRLWWDGKGLGLSGQASWLAVYSLGMMSAAAAVQVTYQVNLGAQIALGNFRPGTDTIFVSGTFSSPSWKQTASDGSSSYLLSPVGGDSNLYTGTFNIVNTAGSSENHKFVINPRGNFTALNWESPTSTLGGNRTFVVPGTATNLPVVYFNDQQLPAAAPFIAGADFSDLSFFESRGKSYKDNGHVQDGLAILKNSGLTCVRLRLWTGSDALVQTSNAYNFTNNLTYTLPLAVRVKNAGLQFMLDFHYSDTWADPGKQGTPSAWTSLNFAQLVQQMHDYNSNCIAAFKAAGAMPDYVQVGNEITGGMLWTNGAVPGNNATAQWSKLGQLMKAAVQGIADAAGTNMPKIIVHIDRGGDWSTTQWFFDNLNAQGVPYDIIGESYYPFWHGPLSNVANCFTNAAKRYAKPVIIAETAFPWTNSYWTTNIYGIPGTTNGQVQFLVALAQVVKNVPAQLGAGIFWWGAEYQPANGVNEAGFNTASFFDAGGNVLPVADAFGQLTVPVRLSPSLAGPTLTLQWPLSGAGMGLTTATNLLPLASWLPVTNAVQTTGTWFTVTLPVDSVQGRFYRLQSN
ncbi:MAG TPA: glycosyl hydrolase 53 family protein [Candidatus Acidoferrum sp.]|nr:glycosyl hydrolase 53 family protein [Candidatus Acidoferrum sp.]